MKTAYFIRKCVKISIFAQEINKNSPKKWGYTAILMKNALILCNPQDKM